VPEVRQDMFRRLRGGGRGDDESGGDDSAGGGGGSEQVAPPPIAPPAIETGPPMDVDAALDGLAGKRVRTARPKRGASAVRYTCR
jgi:hypothetical protein